jgi:hypothetical protein
VGLKQLVQRESKPRASIHAVSCKPQGAAGSLAVALEGRRAEAGLLSPLYQGGTKARGRVFCALALKTLWNFHSFELCPYFWPCSRPRLAAAAGGLGAASGTPRGAYRQTLPSARVRITQIEMG